MANNIETDTQVNIKAGGLGIARVGGSDGWYMVPYGLEQEWHYGRRFCALRGTIEQQLEAVIEQCQGGDAFVLGKGSGAIEWHGPFMFPQPPDFPEAIICSICWALFQHEIKKGA